MSYLINDEINIAISCDDNYILPARIMLNSLFKNNNREHISIYLIYSNVSNDNIRLLKTDTEKYCWKFYAVEVPKQLDDVVDSMISYGHFTKDMYYRLFLPYLLLDCNKILYLDVDMMIRGGIKELYDEENKDMLAAAVPDMNCRMRYDGKHRLKLCENAEYYNSGMQLLYLDRIRNEITFDEALDLSKKILDDYHIVFPDQDIFNLMYQGRISCASKYWNYGASNSPLYKLKHPYELKKAMIVHFDTDRKPWKTSYSFFYLFEYWRYLKQYINKKQRINYWICKPFALLKMLLTRLLNR